MQASKAKVYEEDLCKLHANSEALQAISALPQGPGCKLRLTKPLCNGKMDCWEIEYWLTLLMQFTISQSSVWLMAACLANLAGASQHSFGVIDALDVVCQASNWDVFEAMAQ